LKIDGSFVRNMLNDPIDRAMVESINHIGHMIGLQTIAEYVEDDHRHSNSLSKSEWTMLRVMGWYNQCH
jgi:EAL domain-containing protein (putative c-di-GMP-specific phosphodiesterase class I)